VTLIAILDLPSYPKTAEGKAEEAAGRIHDSRSSSLAKSKTGRGPSILLPDARAHPQHSSAVGNLGREQGSRLPTALTGSIRPSDPTRMCPTRRARRIISPRVAGPGTPGIQASRFFQSVGVVLQPIEVLGRGHGGNCTEASTTTPQTKEALEQGEETPE